MDDKKWVMYIFFLFIELFERILLFYMQIVLNEWLHFE